MAARTTIISFFCMFAFLSASAWSAVPIETRLWCPDDIESLYAEMVEIEKRILPERYDESEAEKVAEILKRVEQMMSVIPGIGILGVEGMLLWDVLGAFVKKEDARESDIMRRFAYSVLRNWNNKNAAKNARDGVIYSIITETRGSELVYGKAALKRAWAQWRYEWGTILRDIFGTEPDDFDERIDKFAARWGMDPDKGYDKVPPAELIPANYLPENVNCTWFMCVELSDNRTEYYAIFVKEGSLLGEWTGENTEVLSQFVSMDSVQQGPYPTEMAFRIPYSARDNIHFTESSYYYAYENNKWLKTVAERKSGNPDVLTLEVDYPIRKGGFSLTPKWKYANGWVSSERDRNFDRVLKKIQHLAEKGKDIGTELRKRSGKFKYLD